MLLPIHICFKNYIIIILCERKGYESNNYIIYDFHSGGTAADKLSASSRHQLNHL